MKKLIFVPFLIIIVLSFISCNSKSENNTQQSKQQEVLKKESKKIPEFNMKTLKKVLTENPNKIVLLNFWATWCGACREEIPDLIQFYDEYKNKVTLIGLSLDTSDEDIESFIKLAKINFPIYKADQQLAQHFMVQTIPATYIFKNGKFINVHIGPYYYSDLKKDIAFLENQKQ